MHDALPSNPWLPPLITGAELAAMMRYSGVTSAFRGWLKTLGIKSVPGRNDLYDPYHVRHRLDIAQGMALQAVARSDAPETKPTFMSLTEERRRRRGK